MFADHGSDAAPIRTKRGETVVSIRWIPDGAVIDKAEQAEILQPRHAGFDGLPKLEGDPRRVVSAYGAALEGTRIWLAADIEAQGRGKFGEGVLAGELQLH